MGSPPRVRGREQRELLGLESGGITPARAGKSMCQPFHVHSSWDHPRACGEEFMSEQDCEQLMGSPPRVRGRVCEAGAPARTPGITPARAGKRITAFADARGERDHPRACGEEGTHVHTTSDHTGSPPRVRGRACVNRSMFIPPGITPARAGKRHTASKHIGRCGDHPRACGEECPAVHHITSGRGSPPRVRGRALNHSRTFFPARITPARAGKSPVPASTPERIWDHPRACGEETKRIPIISHSV